MNNVNKIILNNPSIPRDRIRGSLII